LKRQTTPANPKRVLVCVFIFAARGVWRYLACFFCYVLAEFGELQPRKIKGTSIILPLEAPRVNTLKKLILSAPATDHDDNLVKKEIICNDEERVIA
jgi:hypothetical protein